MSIDNPTTPLDRALGAEERANERVCDLEDLRDKLLSDVERYKSELNSYDKALRCEGWHFEARIKLAKELAEAPATITRLQGEAGVLRELLVIALSVIGTLEPEEASECVMLMELQNQITAAVTPPGKKSYGPQCTCLGSQLGPHYCEVHAA